MPSVRSSLKASVLTNLFPCSCFPLEKHISICTVNFQQQFLSAFSGDFHGKQFLTSQNISLIWFPKISGSFNCLIKTLTNVISHSRSLKKCFCLAKKEKNPPKIQRKEQIFVAKDTWLLHSATSPPGSEGAVLGCGCPAGVQWDAQGCARVCKGLQGCTKMCKGAQGCVRMCQGVHKSIQGCIKMLKDVQGCTSVCNAVQGYGRACKDEQRYTSYARMYKGMHGCIRMYKDAKVHEDAHACSKLCKVTRGCTRVCKGVPPAHGSKEQGRAQQCSQHPKEAVSHCGMTCSSGTWCGCRALTMARGCSGLHQDLK